MYTINIDKECGCFRRSGLENNTNFETNDAALLQANSMVRHMNTNFCAKHEFVLTEQGNRFQISMQAPQSKASCCGGGHCS